jgi:hypothetical protein
MDLPVDMMEVSLKERLWHTMREDLASYAPELKANKLLMCCGCGRLLPQEDFSLEHIIPRQALSDQPAEVRARLTANQRSGNILLCTKPLKMKGRLIYPNGCNSWKGRCYDKLIREILNGTAVDNPRRRFSNQYIIALLCLGYIAMVSTFGYQVALTLAGVLSRQQFFMPNRFHPDMPMRSQMVLMAPPIEFQEEHFPMWERPFSLTIAENSCLFGIRSIVIHLPISRNPETPIAKRIMIAPAKYALRPDFRTMFD